MMVMLYFLCFNAREHTFCNNKSTSWNLLIAFEAKQFMLKLGQLRKPRYFSTANNNHNYIL